MDLSSTNGSHEEEVQVTPFPCTSQTPCNKDETSQPVLSCDNSWMPQGVNHNPAIISAHSKIDILLEKVKDEVKTEVASIKEDLKKAQEDFDKAQKQHALEIQKLWSLIGDKVGEKFDELRLASHESRIAEIEHRLDINKEMAERKATRFHRVETNTTLPDSPSRASRDRKDSGLSMTSVYSSTDDPEDDPGYGSTLSSRNSSYSELKPAPSRVGGVLDVVVESNGDSCN